MWIMSHHFDHGDRIIIKKMMRNACHLASSCRFIKKQCMLVINNFLMLVTNSFFKYNSVYESEWRASWICSQEIANIKGDSTHFYCHSHRTDFTHVIQLIPGMSHNIANHVIYSLVTSKKLNKLWASRKKKLPCH